MTTETVLFVEIEERETVSLSPRYKWRAPNGHLVVSGGKQRQSLGLTIRLILDRGRN